MAVALNEASGVLLGFPDEFMRSEKDDAVDFTTSKIGGSPVSFNSSPSFSAR